MARSGLLARRRVVHFLHAETRASRRSARARRNKCDDLATQASQAIDEPVGHYKRFALQATALGIRNALLNLPL